MAVKRKKSSKDVQSEADRLSAIARAYGLDSSGRAIAGVGGKVTGLGESAAAKKRALEAAGARAKAQAGAAKAKAKSKDKFDPDPETDKKGGSASGGLTEAERLANELARLKIQAEYDKADREAEKVLADREATTTERAEALAERERKFSAYTKIAEVYGGQGKQTDALYAGQLEDLPNRKKDDLDALLKAVGAGRGQIAGAQNQFLSSLVTPTAYSNVPLVDFSTAQPVNPLMGALGAEGASTAGVTGQSAMDAQLAAQYAQLARNTAGQLNTGSQNYMTALRNAGTGAAAAGLQELATQQTGLQNQINTRYSDLTNQLAMQRLQAQQDAAARTATAQADAAQYAPTAPTVTPEMPVRVPEMPVRPVVPQPEMPVAPVEPVETEEERRRRIQAIVGKGVARY